MKARSLGKIGYCAAYAVLWAAYGVTLQAQGILTVTPGKTVGTVAGNGTVGYSANGNVASAVLASPTAVIYDSAGDLYFADAANNVVQEITTAGIITTIAGTGHQGFGGDGGAATSAYLDTPTGIALDASGNLYIADSHNHRIREVRGGTITTIAGTGTAGFSGDGGAATAAQLALPSAVAVDTSGNLYIADTNNHRIRLVSGTAITTLAGNGEELYSGDGGPATAASLDSPTDVAVDATGQVYIADRHNQRIRVVAGGGIISTVAGSGTPGFSGGYSGDSGSATAATLAKPVGVSVDASGNIYIADTNNQRILQVSGGAIATVAGTGEQGFGGDGGPAAAAILNTPKAVATDASGNLVIADTLNDRLRSDALAALTFSSQIVGIPSAPQSITLANSGTAAITLSSLVVSGAFTTASGGSCPAAPITLAPGANCTANIAFLPTTAGAANGSITATGFGIVPQTVLLTGNGSEATTSLTLASNNAAAFVNQPVVFTATVQPAGAGIPTGTVSFYDGTTLLGTVQPVAGDTASLAITALAEGTHSITAVYSGDSNFAGSSSTALTEVISDFSLTSTPNPSDPAGSLNQTVVPGQAAVFGMTIQPISGPFPFPVTLSATGLPPGASVTFNPQVATLGAAPVNFTMTIQTAAATASVHRTELFGSGTVAFALLMLPFSGTLRRRIRFMHPFMMMALLLSGGTIMTLLTGCGGGGFFGQQQKTYTIQITATATGANAATLQHVGTVQLTLQ